MGPIAKPRKRNRKRKRQDISSSSSSSSSEEDGVPKASLTKPPLVEDDSEDSDSSSSSSSFSSSTHTHETLKVEATPAQAKLRHDMPSRSPSPPKVTITPSFALNPTTEAEKEKETALKDKFRKFWMASVADGFKDDLEEIRKEPNISTSRLSLLIDSLASGADVFSSSAQANSGGVNEMEIVLGAP